MHFDIHHRDIAPAFGVLDVNLALDVPADYCIHWRYGALEKEQEADFLLLRAFNDKQVHWCLHADILSSHYRQHYGQEQNRDYLHWIHSDEFAAHFREILADPASLQELEHDLETLLADVNASFRQHFPHGCFVSSHGSPMNSVLQQFSRDFPKKGAALNSSNFLNQQRLDRLNLGVASYAFIKAKGLAYISDAGFNNPDIPMIYQQLEAASKRGKSLAILIHPYVLQWKPHHYRFP